MRSPHVRRRALLLTLVALVAALPACSDDDNGTGPGNEPAYVGTWNATSFTAGGMDVIVLAQVS